MTLKPVKSIGQEANASARDNTNAPESPRLRNDSFSRRGYTSEAHSKASPTTSTRALSHRPSPLVLPPLPQREYSYRSRSQHSNDERIQNQESNCGNQQTNDNSGTSPESSTSQRGRKRRYTPDSDCDEDDESYLVESYSSSDDDAEDGQGQVSTTATNGIEASRPDSLRCLCLRPKKIPRPRNVFMLYRQQTHADVVAENPGIANPDISKIIGRRWKSMTEEEKAPWKELAEEEKRLHREMYPNYRYQPKRARRAGGGQSDSPSSSSNRGLGNPNSSELCEKCGLPYAAPPRSARPIPSSARTSRPLPSPFGIVQGHTEPATPGGFGTDRSRSSAPFPSPGYLPHEQNSPYGQRSSSRDAYGRRPLPQINRPSTGYSGPRGQGNFQDATLEMPFSDENRRRYDPPTPYAANYPPNVSAQQSHFTLPHRPRHYDDPSLPAQLPHSASIPHFPASASARPSPSTWMGPPPPPVRQPTRGYATHPSSAGEPATPRSAHSGRDEGYGPSSGMLPPPSYDAQGYYYSSRGSVSSGVGTPLTAMAGLSMHQTPAFMPVIPSLSRTMDHSKAAAGTRERLLHQMHPKAASGYTDESLELPPLMTGVPPVLKSVRQGHADTVMSDRQAGISAPNSQATLHALAQSDRHATAPGDIATGDDTDTQESGVRAMIMNVPYLNKLEVLRRICPPRRLQPRRGPIIAIEGHNAALRKAVGRAVQRALVQSGECNVIARTAMSLDGRHKDSNMAPSPALGYYDSGDHNENKCHETPAPDSLAFSVSTICECLPLVSRVKRASGAIIEHISPSTGCPESSKTAKSAASQTGGPSKPMPAGPPSPASPPTTHAAATSDTVVTSETAPTKVETHSPASISPPSSPAREDTAQFPLLPVALITTGYTLAIADKCAVSVVIDDSFGPLDHWEFMATIWRGLPGPDLVVYADASPPPAAERGSETTVHAVEQEGVLVVHVPLSDTGKKKVTVSKDSKESKDASIDTDDEDVLIDQKTERRLAFEVMEFMRSEKFGMVKKED